MISGWLSIGVGAPAGLCLGSYAVTAAVRTARAEGSSRGRSHCDGCGVGLRLAETVPVCSYVLLRGACRLCGERIDPLHPTGEIMGGLVVAASFALLPLTVAPLPAALGLVLLAAAVFDTKTQRLPDVLTVVAGLLCAALTLTHGAQRLALNAAIAAAAFVLLEVLRRLFIRTRGEPGLGFGDVKLISASALWLGAMTPWMVTVAAGAGLAAIVVTKPNDRRIAFGPFIAAATFGLGLMLEVRQWP